MKKIRYYIVAMRLRTLPLSLAGVILGLMLAAADYHVRWGVVIFTLLTTLSLQLLSNVANELGDALKGTDRADRQGPGYTVSTGLLKPKDLKRMIWAYVILSVCFGLAMIKSSGYRGLGDVFVFIFFGIVSVLGSYFVAAHDIPSWYLLLPAVSMGAFSVAVLNVNNIRDMKTDAATRVTIPIRIGEKWAKVYQTALIVAGWGCMFAYAFSRMYSLWHYLFVLTLPLFVMHVAGVWKRHGKDLDPMLPLLVVSTFLFAVLGGLGFVVFLF